LPTSPLHTLSLHDALPISPAHPNLPHLQEAENAKANADDQQGIGNSRAPRSRQENSPVDQFPEFGFRDPVQLAGITSQDIRRSRGKQQSQGGQCQQQLPPWDLFSTQQ